MIAVVPVRDGALPAGGTEVVAEAAGRVLLVGSGTAEALDDLGPLVSDVDTWETEGFAPGAWSHSLASLLADEELVLLPASPDGRDLAPRVAAVLGHELFSGAVEIRDELVRTVGFGATAMVEHHLTGAAVVTLQPGVRGIDPSRDHHSTPPVVRDLTDELDSGGPSGSTPDAPPPRDCVTIEVLPPDASTMDLAEAPRILAGGNGLGDPESFERLAEVARALDASVGTTRVITDKGWLPHERQIGTTGVVVDPRLYVAFGISGAVQHTSGLGQPDHVISVNTDPHCPMMSLADLAVVADAGRTLEVLAGLLGTGEATHD
ncbi:MAG: mycofactocin-associated electron transfer flavoprotein alpha subunit [Microthrixaceae bacterium]|nr:mycofactocin-associated electron transfer flavoprotein alpha subunit [Microthrixaceae bacterium]MCO5317658.1 mycofactocin-associated electron transfer flavoprotein alpha subunit [Microthrixaceae bacterium]